MSVSISLVYATNIWSHHQAPVATEMARIMGWDSFRMALFEEVPVERRKMGYGERDVSPWLIGPPADDQDKNRLLKQCQAADVLVFGACPMELLMARVSMRKLTLVATERLLKKEFHRVRLLNPRYAGGFREYRALVNHPFVHALTIGHFAPDDLRTVGVFGNRMWKWGYFGEVNAEPPRQMPSKGVNLLWVGRMVDWKRVDLLLRAVARISSLSAFSECTIVGDGPEKTRLLRLARHLHLDPTRVRFVPSVPVSEVRRLMRESDIYVLTSNRQEGWGVPANEAMSEGCVLVANQDAGAAQELVVHNETGFLFSDGDDQHLSGILECLINDRGLRMRLRQKAWERMNALWHPRVAAERLIRLCEGLLRGDPPSFVEGPCSKEVA